MEPRLLVIVPLASCCVALCAIFALAYTNFGRRKYALSWSLTFGCVALMYLLGLAQHLFPSPSVQWLVSAALSCTAVTLGIRGHLQRVGRDVSVGYAIVGIAVYGVSVWSTLLHPHAGLQVASLPLHAAVMNGLAAWIVVSARPRTQPVEWCLASSLLLFAMSQLAAGLVALSQGEVRDPQVMALYFNLNFLAMPACFLAMGMFSVLILANDLAEEMRELATIDSLTGLANRRGMNDALNRAWALASRADSTISLLLADLDDFKSVNDTHGHDVGDQVLKEIAGRLRDQGRDGDMVARWGGEEFLILLQDTSADDAKNIAERIDRNLRDAPVATPAGLLNISASIGSATTHARMGTVEDLIQLADAAMYERKLARKKQQQRVTSAASMTFAVRPS